ncbi:hypothetical protein [Nocardia yamanashiensis]|uniref:hypothetical protein n=1 Tax=Nocardia yamanashiensis TaxID=209247 RepID=UPI0012FCA5B8|nr:hypothetical protein [Nocardia yamanashiensis]
MTDSFMVAARIAMSRDGFEEWLDTPIPGVEVVGNPGAVFDGWFWDGKASDSAWGRAETGVTPREFFRKRREIGRGGVPMVTVLVHRDEALHVYLFDIGYIESDVFTAFLALAGAGRFKTAGAADIALFWAETSGGLCGADWDGWLAALEVGRESARFVHGVDLGSTIEGLRVGESLFYEQLERGLAGEERFDWETVTS